MISLKALTRSLTTAERGDLRGETAPQETALTYRRWISDRYICGGMSEERRDGKFQLTESRLSVETDQHVTPQTLKQELPELVTICKRFRANINATPAQISLRNLQSKGLWTLEQQSDCHRARSGGKAGALLENVARCFIHRCRAAGRISARFFLSALYSQLKISNILTLMIYHDVGYCAHLLKACPCGTDKSNGAFTWDCNITRI